MKKLLLFLMLFVATVCNAQPIYNKGYDSVYKFGNNTYLYKGYELTPEVYQFFQEECGDNKVTIRFMWGQTNAVKVVSKKKLPSYEKLYVKIQGVADKRLNQTLYYTPQPSNGYLDRIEREAIRQGRRYGVPPSSARRVMRDTRRRLNGY